MKIKNIGIIIFCLLAQTSHSACTITNSESHHNADALSTLLNNSTQCPHDVFAFRQLLKKSNFTLETTMVANRGFHNPSEGSFSLFEIVSGKSIAPGDFFFGHFTGVDDQDQLTADQSPEKGSLMIEAIAWDAQKSLFNFYELRGDGVQGQWFYRGDSADIFADNQMLHRQVDAKHPQFGNRLRCSGCHDEGGPIMKELSLPHNDWWEPKRKLDFGGRKNSAELKDIMQTLVPADRLANVVRQGVNKLDQQHLSLSLQEQLRPLFCPLEVNFKSDNIANDAKNSEIHVPSGFFVDDRLAISDVVISRANYEAALTALGIHFPETALQDADHAWLTPVKAESDQIAITRLVKSGLIDDKFVADVLDIDMTNPVVSPARCHLLRFVPAVKTADWREVFIRNLLSSHDADAQQLAANMTDVQHTVLFYQNKAENFLHQCRLKLQNKNNVEDMIQLLLQRREEIRASEISFNPRGQILEPGFRVIFPESEKKQEPFKLKLNLRCEVT